MEKCKEEKSGEKKHENADTYEIFSRIEMVKLNRTKKKEYERQIYVEEEKAHVKRATWKLSTFPYM